MRCLIHENVLLFSIIQHRRHGTQFQLAELQVLVSGSWPGLKHLQVEYIDKLQTQAAKLPEGLHGAAWSVLVFAQWHSLKCLDLSGACIGPAATAELRKADWPLQAQNLNLNAVDVKEPSGQF